MGAGRPKRKEEDGTGLQVPVSLHSPQEKFGV
jgi:hypothetical protein